VSGGLLMQERAGQRWSRGRRSRARTPYGRQMQAVQRAKIAWAQGESRRFLGDLTPRWEHVQAVARLADVVGKALGPEGDLLIAAAWLHDIGYAPELAVTGFHPADGARFLRAGHHDEALALLVAHHSGARYEARLRGVSNFEDEFPCLDSDLDRALTYCDLTTGPTGQRVRLHDRITEIQQRYGPDHTVSNAMTLARPELEYAVLRTEELIERAGIQLSGSLAYPGSGSR